MIPKLDVFKLKWNVDSADTIKPGLDSIKRALMLLKNPEKSLNVVHIAGTNGKGSTLTFIENIAMEHGLSVGKFMSPCILDVHDQIQVNGKPISDSDMDFVFKQLSDANVNGLLTDFELLTCAAFLHFSNKNVDLVLLETGMGGREDSTNVVLPIVSVITSIALEHTKFLGTTIESIASHKAGIIKSNRPVVIGDLPLEAHQVIKQEALSKNAIVYYFGEHFQVQLSDQLDTYTNLKKGIQIENLSRSLPGDHQGVNMAVAITAFLEVAKFFHLHVDEYKIRIGVTKTKVPGRFEQVLENVYFDGAHNPASAEKLAQTIKQQFPNSTIRFVVGMLADKDVTSVLRILETVSDEFYFVDFSNERAMNAEEMLKLSNATKKQLVRDSIGFIKQARNEECVTVVTGSLYLLAQLRERIIEFN